MKHFLRTLVLTAVALVATVSFTSCDDGDDGWWGPIDDTYLDANLDGVWQLYMANGQLVSPYDTSYLEFFGNGTGFYYYYVNGMQSVQRTRWICNRSYSRQTLTIRYQDGAQDSMNYWFNSTGHYLYLNWYTGSGYEMTYCYRYNGNHVPW